MIRSIKNTVTGELDLTREVEYARKAALAAGEILMRYYGTDYEIGSKGKNNPVTIAGRISFHTNTFSPVAIHQASNSAPAVTNRKAPTSMGGICLTAMLIKK